MTHTAIAATYFIFRFLRRPHDARRQALNAEREAAFNSLLTPAERSDYELRNSAAAQAVRDSLKTSNLKVTESEFRQLFAARIDYQSKTEQAARGGQGSVAEAWSAYLRIGAQVLGPNRPLAPSWQEL